jgi:MoaA/NifB/PqqE/SkfB family radical SAM enzyme
MTRELSPQSYFGVGQVPIGIGAVLKGWDLSTEEYRDPTRFPAVDFRAMTSNCLHNCYHCFTDKNKKTLTFEEIKGVIDQIAEIGAKGIDYIGEGEPTLDPDFFKIIGYTHLNGIVPIVFTDAATKLRDRKFVRRLKDCGASVSPKCDSLFNYEYQNFVVGDKSEKYFRQRNEAIELLVEEGFNEPCQDGTTRIGFDMVVTKRNIDEVEKTLRYSRENNFWVGFSWFLPTGRSGKEDFDRSLAVNEEEKQNVRDIIKRVDSEYGFNHPIYRNFGTFPCVELMQIHGDGRVSLCPGNETMVGNVRTDKIKDLQKRIYQARPKRHPSVFDGNCLCREVIQIGGGK